MDNIYLILIGVSLIAICAYADVYNYKKYSNKLKESQRDFDYTNFTLENKYKDTKVQNNLLKSKVKLLDMEIKELTEENTSLYRRLRKQNKKLNLLKNRKG